MATIGSLFTGVGGMDLGFERAGFDVRWQVENDRDCIAVLEQHWPGIARYGDVRGVAPEVLESVDVIAFGSPCQGFSTAGRQEGLKDTRSELFSEAIRIVRGARPAFVVWENVVGSLSTNGGRDFGAVLDALADAGALDIGWRVLDALGFGVPQKRRRVFLVADFGGRRAGAVLFEPERGGRHPLEGKVYRRNLDGGPYGATRSDSVLAFGWQAGGYGDTSFRGKTRSYPVRAGPYVGAVSASRHDAVMTATMLRRTTPRENERFQGWPDDWTRYRADGSEFGDGPRYRMIGNGAPAPVVEWIARRLMAVAS
jgi:DNA (cytosine-5)-methyltransferase 1